MPYTHLLDICDLDECHPMTVRAANGFLDRLRRGSLNRPEQFEVDVEEHVTHWSNALPV